jgi:hypothetical protein
MPSAELVIELPAEEADFLRAYARDHGTTVAKLMARYAQALRNAPRRPPHPANAQDGKINKGAIAETVRLARGALLDGQGRLCRAAVHALAA